MTNRLSAHDGCTSRPVTAPAVQHDLDRLAAGDLSPSERRRLLAALEDEPDGWRRCALAFLEAQSWREACRQLTAEPSGQANAPEASVRRRAWRPSTRPLAAGIAAAAAVLVAAFWGGLAIGRAWPITLPSVAEDSSPSKTASVPGASRDGSHTPVADSHGNDPAVRRREARAVLQVLGVIHVPGEDGARHAVPILAAPGLRIEAPQRQPGTLAAAPRSAAAADLQPASSPGASLDGEPSLPLAGGQRVAIPADWLSALADGQSVY